MARRKRDDGILAVVADLPWWIGVSLAAVSYVGVRIILPAMWANSSPVLKSISTGLQQVAWVFPFVFLVAAAISFLKSLKRRKLVDSQTGIHSIREISWQDFERMVGEVFRRHGYHVEEQGGAAPDGGIDLVLYKAGHKSIVQCKRWKNAQVGVSLVRELYGVMAAEKADSCIFISSGTYTADALAFADGKPIQLVDGEMLASLLREVQRQQTAAPLQSEPMSSEPTCPKCGSSMIRRTAKTGANAGKQFWGCSRYPQCRGIVQ